MHYLINLIIPLILTTVYVLLSESAKPLTEIISTIGSSLFGLSFWHLFWALGSAIFRAPKVIVISAFIALHIFLVAVSLLVLTSSSNEAVQGWFLYIMFAPVAIVIGANIGSHIEHRR